MATNEDALKEQIIREKLGMGTSSPEKLVYKKNSNTPRAIDDMVLRKGDNVAETAASFNKISATPTTDTTKPEDKKTSIDEKVNNLTSFPKMLETSNNLATPTPPVEEIPQGTPENQPTQEISTEEEPTDTEVGLDYEVDDTPEEENEYGSPEEIQNEDPEVGAQAVSYLAQTDTFNSPEQIQAAMNLYGSSPSVQQFFRTSPTEMVLQTAMGRELQKLADEHTIVPERPDTGQKNQPFQKGNGGVYVDPVSGKPVSRPGFFKRLGNAIKYALGFGDMYETQPMQLNNTQTQPQQQANPYNQIGNSSNMLGSQQLQGAQTAQLFNPFNNLQYQQDPQLDTKQTAYAPQMYFQQPQQQNIQPYWDLPMTGGRNSVYNPYSPFESLQQ